MPNYAAPTKDIEFILFDLMNISASPILRYCDLDPALVSALVHEVGNISTDILLPLKASGDAEGCRLDACSLRQAGLFLSSKRYGTVAGVG